MILIEIDNSVSKITGLDRTQTNELKQLLAYRPENNYFNRYPTPTKYLISKGGEFPTGLLHIVKRYLKGTEFSINDNRRRILPFLELFIHAKLPTLRPFQKDAITAVYERMRGIISCPTGSGKSLIIAGLIKKLQVPTLVVVPSLELKRQLTETLSGIFGSENVGKSKPIVVKNIDEINLKIEETSYHCVIIDEFHHSAAETYRKANKKCWNKIYWRCGVTATPFRSQPAEQILLESVLSRVVYELPYTEAVTEKFVVPVEAHAISVPKTLATGTTWRQVYSSQVVHNSIRNELIKDLLLRLQKAKKYTLCLVKEIDHGKILSEMTGLPFVNGEDGNARQYIEAFNSGQHPILIGTSGVLGEGIDTRPCEYVIIAGLGKAKNTFMQNVGRGLRPFPESKESCKVVIFMDKSHKFTLRHYREQVKILKEEYGAEINF